MCVLFYVSVSSYSLPVSVRIGDIIITFTNCGGGEISPGYVVGNDSGGGGCGGGGGGGVSSRKGKVNAVTLLSLPPLPLPLLCLFLLMVVFLCPWLVSSKVGAAAAH